MRKSLRFAVIILLFIATHLQASDTFVNGIWYDFDNSTMTATVTYQGASSSSHPDEYSGNVTIPASVLYNGRNYSVTDIGEEAFYQCSRLITVTIPNSVTNIGRFAFWECSNLTSIVIPNSVTEIKSATFFLCSSMTSVTIPNSVMSIGDYAFYECSSLTSMDIPDGVQDIKNATFYKCSSMISVTIPNSVKSIGDWAFEYCSSLKSIVIPDSVTSIGNYAFSDCSSLTSIDIPNSVTCIENGAFAFCSNLTDIFVPCGEIDRFKQLLGNDNRVKYEPLQYAVTVNADHGFVTYQGETICDVLTATPDYGYHFARWSDGNTDNPREIVWTQDTTITAEFDMDTIGVCGDYNLLTWKYDNQSKTLEIIGEGTLNSNYTFGLEAPNNLKKLLIAEGVTSIGTRAFANQATLQEVSLPTTLEYVGEQAFYGCTGVAHIYNYRDIPTMAENNSFDGVDKEKCTLYVLESSVDLYKEATVWRDFYTIRIIENGGADIDAMQADLAPRKFIRDNQVLILRDGKTYTIQGVEVR